MIPVLTSLAISLVPQLARLLAGDKAGNVADAVASAAREVTGISDPMAAREALEQSQEMQAAFRVKVMEISLEAERIANADKNSAREREAKTGDSWTPRILALVWTLAACGFGAAIIGWADVSPGQKELANLIIGFLSAKIGTILDYYFGSSARRE